MRRRIVKRESPIEMRFAVYKISRARQRNAHDAMRYHQGGDRPSLLGEHQELRRKLTHRVTMTQKLKSTENNSSGSSGGSPSASACSISRRACSTATVVSAAVWPLVCVRAWIKAT
jgi:hypothetical protein